MSYRSLACLLLATCLLSPKPSLAQTAARSASTPGITPPTKIKNVEPVYPESAQREGIQGVVVIEATVGVDGKVREAKVMQSIPRLDAAALAAVRQWEYEPAKVDGVARTVIMTVRVAFALGQRGSPPPANTQSPTPPTAETRTPLSAPVQREWDKTWQDASKLALDAKYTEAIAVMEAFIRRNPNAGEAHYLVSSMYEQRSFAATPAAKRRDIESAATHVARAAVLMTDPNMRFMMTWKLARLYGPDDLNDPARAERYARELVEKYPERAESHMVLAQLIREKGDIAGAAEIMRKGLAATELPVPGLLLAMQYPVEQVQHDRGLAPEITQARLHEALAAADAILAKPDKEERDLRLATMGKAMVLELQAERVARDRQERIALLVESERWGAAMTEFKNGQPPAARRLSAGQAADLEWEALRRWNARLADDGRVADAVAAHNAYLATRPGFYPVHQELADLFLRTAEGASDARTRTSNLEQAAAQLQRVVELAPAGDARDGAFDRLLELYGPARLNQPARQEATARTLIKQTPNAPRAHYALAAVLFRTGNSTGGEEALRAARTAIKPAPASRAGMASAIVRVIGAEDTLPTASKQRLFDEAAALLTEAEKLAGTREDLAVIEARMSWLNLSAISFEKDPARAAAQRAEAERLAKRAIAIYEKQAPARR